MKKIFNLGILLLIGLLLFGCGAKNITQAEAGGIATTYVIENYGLNAEAIEIQDITLNDDGWHIQLLIGDDKGTVILDQKGNFVKLESYNWV